MRKNLGRVILVFFLLLGVGLQARTYTWSSYVSKKEAYINEAIHLKYVCEFDDKGELYAIEFNPQDVENLYTIELLKNSDEIVNGKRVSSFEYVAYAKKSGKLEFKFDVGMKKTTLEFIVDSTGSRDDDKGSDYLYKRLRQPNLSINIKDSKSDLVGDFVMSVNRDKPTIKTYEPYHLDVKLTGSGNFNSLSPLEFKIDGVKVFNDKPKLDIKLTKNGYVGSWNQKFAFVSEKDFEIPELRINYFDINTHSLKELVIDSASIKVQEGFKKEELLDSKEEVKTFDFEFIYYILTFIAGFLVAKVKFKSRIKETRENVFSKKVKDCESLNELSIILALENDKKYDKLILDIESKQITSLKEAKNNVELE